MRRAILVAVTLAALAASVLALLQLFPESQATTEFTVMAAAAIPYGIFLWALALLGFATCGFRWHRLWAIPVLIALIVHLGWTRPYWPNDPPAVTGDELRILASNLRFGKASPESVADAITQTHPDVVVFTEVTQTFLTSPSAMALRKRYPYQIGRAAPGHLTSGRKDASGTIVLSRLPMTEIAKIPSTFDQYIASVAAPGGPITLVAAHPTNMIGSANRWLKEGRELTTAVRPYTAGPLVVAGDLNATPEHLTVRELLAAGLTLSSAQAGAGWQPTWRLRKLPVGPMFPIDHVLTSDALVAKEYRTLPIAGSDHEAVFAVLGRR